MIRAVANAVSIGCVSATRLIPANARYATYASRGVSLVVMGASGTRLAHSERNFKKILDMTRIKMRSWLMDKTKRPKTAPIDPEYHERLLCLSEKSGMGLGYMVNRAIRLWLEMPNNAALCGTLPKPKKGAAR